MDPNLPPRFSWGRKTLKALYDFFLSLPLSDPPRFILHLRSEGDSDPMSHSFEEGVLPEIGQIILDIGSKLEIEKAAYRVTSVMHFLDNQSLVPVAICEPVDLEAYTKAALGLQVIFRSGSDVDSARLIVDRLPEIGESIMYKGALYEASEYCYKTEQNKLTCMLIADSKGAIESPPGSHSDS